MARKTPIDKLNSAISDILAKYSDEIDENVGAIAIEMGRKGVQALKSSSKEAFPMGSGRYAGSWKQQVEQDRLNTVVTIYSTIPSRPHLLEYGHVIRNGTGRVYGRVSGREHIKPVADELIETFEREVAERL